MKSIEELLRNLARPDVLEFGLVTNRLPSINVGGRFEPVDDHAPSTDRVIQMLVAMGGARFVDTLSERPVQWTTRLDGVGVIAVAAIMRKDVVQARFTVARRDPAGARPPQQMSAVQTQSGPPVARKEGPAPAVVVRPAQTPQAQAFARTQQGGAAAPAPTPAVQPTPSPVAAPPAAAQPSPSASKIAVQAPKPAPAPAPALVVDEDDEDEEDDNEPTVQTFSPSGTTPPKLPSAAPPSPTPIVEEPRPKPARRPEDVVRESTDAEVSAAVDELEEVKDDVEITTNDSGSRRMMAAKPAPLAVDTETTETDGESIEQTVEVVPGKDKKKEEAKSDPKLEAKTDPSLGTPKEEPKMATGAMPSMPMASAVPSTTPSGVIALEREKPRVDSAAALDSFLAMAMAAHATDLHLVPGRPVLLRVASDLVARTQPIAPEHVDRIVRDIVPSRLREALDGEGACDFTIDHREHGRFRVNVSRHRSGTKLAVRALGQALPSIAALALPEPVSSAIRATRGLVLVTGPAGQGKSTTLAALVDAVNAASARHIYTIEDPIEHVHAKRRGCVTQRELGTHVRSWADGVNDALSSDVDLLVLGELRDEASVRAALVALDGARLVFATMNAASAAKAIGRLIQSVPVVEQARARATIAGSLRLVVGQRLVPSADRTRLCAAYEVIRGSVATHVAVRDDKLDALRPALRLDESLAELVRTQKVTLDVAKQFAEAPAELSVAKKA